MLIVFGIHDGIEGDLGQAFFWSRSSCCGQMGSQASLGHRYDSRWPNTAINYNQDSANHTTILACEVPLLKKSAPYWSHSEWCRNYDYVKYFTTQLWAKRQAYMTMVSLFFLPIGAGIADKKGRKPMFLFQQLMGTKSIICNYLATRHWFIRHDQTAIILYASGIFSGLASGAGPTGQAFMVDLIPVHLRTQGFSILALFGVPSGIVVFAIGYYLLALEWVDYGLFWIICLVTYVFCMVCYILFIPESLPDDLRKPLVWTDFLPFAYYWDAVRLAARRPLLIGLLPCITLGGWAAASGAITATQLLLTHLKFTAAQLLIPGFVGLLMAIPGNIMGAMVIPRIGYWPAIFGGYILSNIFALLGNIWPIYFMNKYDCFSPGNSTAVPPIPAGCPDEMWIPKWGGVLLMGSVFGTLCGCLTGPATSAMISMQVRQNEQATMSAVFSVTGGLSGMYGALWWTNHFLNENATGYEIVKYGFVAQGIGTISVG